MSESDFIDIEGFSDTEDTPPVDALAHLSALTDASVNSDLAARLAPRKKRIRNQRPSTLVSGDVDALQEKEALLAAQIRHATEELRHLEAMSLHPTHPLLSVDQASSGSTPNECDSDDSVENDVNVECMSNEASDIFSVSSSTAVQEDGFSIPEWSVPINADVLSFDFKKLGSITQFDVILMDPPWQLASNAPSRGVTISYSTLSDDAIQSIPMHHLQTNGFLFIWVINAKYVKAFELMEKWGYIYCDDITWVKRTVNRRMAKGHGHYLQHAKETCLVAYKGTVTSPQGGIGSDVIYAERRGQSQKPSELYDLIEQLVPSGKYLEIFGRRNNLRDYWTTIGNEL
ncbi:hypothetical protein HDU78_011610 [Chytriomyces hyalinus]|nr:hypothetical protein HDU78_011610 [Chytriomyces hyalinus]